MKRLGVVLLLAVVALAQNATQNAGSPDAKPASSSGTQGTDLASQVPPPRAEDVKSLDSILLAIYDVISGPAGIAIGNGFVPCLFLRPALHKL